MSAGGIQTKAATRSGSGMDAVTESRAGAGAGRRQWGGRPGFLCDHADAGARPRQRVGMVRQGRVMVVV